VLVSEMVSVTQCRERDLAVNRDLESLTERQRVVANLLSRGACNKEIAAKLNISERTVKAHLTRAFRCFGVSASVDTSKPAIGGQGKTGHRAGAQDVSVVYRV
jgi:DNA-binding NarL/FixJ family response regulator